MTESSKPGFRPRVRSPWPCLSLLLAACGDASSPDSGAAARSELASPAASDSAEPHLARGVDGTVVLSWLQRENGGVALRYSTLGQDGWQAARTVARGNDWFVNWADFPSVVPITPDLWAAHWLAKRPGGAYAYDVAVVLSRDAGRSWSDPITPHTDGTRTEHGFVSLFPWQRGVGVVWLDGRNMTEDTSVHATPSQAGSAGMTLRSVMISEELELIDGELIDELVCDCCQTDVALTPNGPVVVYRDRTADEIRDIYSSRSANREWQPPSPVAQDGWRIGGCPVNGPAIAASGTDVAVAWFTASDDRARVRLAYSSDGAETFSTVVDVDAEANLGRVALVLLDDGTAVVAWLRGSGRSGQICLRRVSRSGEMGPVQAVARTETTRGAGFPQMVRDRDHLIIAWVDVSLDRPRVRTLRLDTASLPGPASYTR